ncbi:hypothetical protein HMPREF3231_01323 [Bifidobacterium longum]|nr:hypothetical protein HMPREF3231_01323 [Bifidobacterium longum]
MTTPPPALQLRTGFSRAQYWLRRCRVSARSLLGAHRAPSQGPAARAVSP